jgi:hypothetical protein
MRAAVKTPERSHTVPGLPADQSGNDYPPVGSLIRNVQIEFWQPCRVWETQKRGILESRSLWVLAPFHKANEPM